MWIVLVVVLLSKFGYCISALAFFLFFLSNPFHFMSFIWKMVNLLLNVLVLLVWIVCCCEKVWFVCISFL